MITRFFLLLRPRLYHWQRRKDFDWLLARFAMNDLDDAGRREIERQAARDGRKAEMWKQARIRHLYAVPAFELTDEDMDTAAAELS